MGYRFAPRIALIQARTRPARPLRSRPTRASPAAGRDRALRAAAAGARHVERVHQGLDRRAAQRRRATTARARTSRGTRSTRSSSCGAGHDLDLAARGSHVRRVLDAARPGRPLPGRTDPRQRPLLPPVGVRERGAGPRPAPERALAARGRRPSGRGRSTSWRRSGSGTRRASHPLHARLGADPGLRFKLDPTPGWDDDLVARARAPRLRRRGRPEGPLPQRQRGAWIRRPACTAA